MKKLIFFLLLRCKLDLDIMEHVFLQIALNKLRPKCNEEKTSESVVVHWFDSDQCRVALALGF